MGPLRCRATVTRNQPGDEFRPRAQGTSALGGLAALLAVAWKNDWGGIQEKTQAVIDFIKPYIEEGIAAVKEAIETALDKIKEFWATWGDDIMGLVQTMIDLVKNIIDTGFGVIKGLFQTVLAVLKGDWKGAWEAMRDTVKTLLDGIRTHVDIILNAIRTAIGSFSLVGAGEALINGMMQGIRNKAGALVDAAKGVINDAKTVICLLRTWEWWTSQPR
jgi:phage-related protein